MCIRDSWHYGEFEIPQEIYNFWNSTEKGAIVNSEWNELLKSYEQKYSQKSKELQRRIDGDLPEGFESNFKDFLSECDSQNSPMATRKASKACLDFFVKQVPELISSSAH